MYTPQSSHKSTGPSRSDPAECECLSVAMAVSPGEVGEEDGHHSPGNKINRDFSSILHAVKDTCMIAWGKVSFHAFPVLSVCKAKSRCCLIGTGGNILL